MPRRYFGTDGVRGIVGDDLTPALVEHLGRAFALWSSGQAVLVGRDTRASGVELERALAAGLAGGGATAHLGGILPTAAVALLAEDGGAVVSASHNPAEYNGVKFFERGAKLSDREEAAVEALLDAPRVSGGSVETRTGLAERYADLVVERFGGPLAGLRIVLDCANGALFRIAPEVFERLGADVVAIAAAPDGTNINAGCGATDLGLLARAVTEHGADLGLAFDGDGDRMLAVDATGQEVDGDQIVAILALHLGVDLVAVTVMTNLGFHRLMEERGIRVVTTDVGDRYVLEALRRERGLLGGEQSGHLMYLEGHVTGDGLVAGLLLCRALVESSASLSEAATVMPRFPQAKCNVPVPSRLLPASLLRRVEAENAALDGRGRLLVRASGTEPVVRVLAEAETEQDAERLCVSMASLVREELG